MVYVDEIMRHGGSATFRWVDSCHMFADTLEELHAMATAIGMKREWFQVSRMGLKHYDLTTNKRHAAVRCGAVTIKGRALLRKITKLRKEQ